MAEEKIVITWDDLQSRQVEKQLKQQDALERNREYARITDLPEASEATRAKNIFYNAIFYMSVFGLLGGLIAWGLAESLHFRASTMQEAQELMTRVNEINHNAEVGRLTDTEARSALRIIAMDGRDNPYFPILSNRELKENDKQARIVVVQQRDRWKELISNIISFGAQGMIIAIFLSIAEAAMSRNLPSVVINGSVAAGLGLLGGIIVAVFVDKLYAALGGVQGHMTSAHQIFARATTWGVIGLTLTLAPGVVMRSTKRLLIGVAGGLLGGIIGGALYDLVGARAQDEYISRLVGMCAIGLVAGAANGFIESVAKTGWLRVVQGLIAGKQFILYRNPTYIGSSPDNQIYLFKDPQVGRRHAAIHVVAGGFEVEDLPLGDSTMVNGRPIQRTRLRQGDRVQIGSTVFVFQEKRPTQAA